KVVVHNMLNQDRKQVLDQFKQFFTDINFIPYNCHDEPSNRMAFWIQSDDLANALRSSVRCFPIKYDVIVTGFPHLTTEEPEVVDTIKIAMSNRYSVETQSLNLSDF